MSNSWKLMMVKISREQRKGGQTLFCLGIVDTGSQKTFFVGKDDDKGNGTTMSMIKISCFAGQWS